MSEYSHPGSTRVVSWREQLPDYVQIEEVPTLGTCLVMDLPEDEVEEKYEESVVVRTMAKVLKEKDCGTDISDHLTAKEFLLEAAKRFKDTKVEVDHYEDMKYD